MTYLVQDGLKYACCALLTAINARRFLDGELCCDLNTEPFEVMVDVTSCRHGAALSMPKAHQIFGLHTEFGPHSVDWIMHRLVQGRPVELTVYAPDWGSHSVLCIGATHEHAYLVNWQKGAVISEVAWSELEVPRYARDRARAFALRE